MKLWISTSVMIVIGFCCGCSSSKIAYADACLANPDLSDDLLVLRSCHHANEAPAVVMTNMLAYYKRPDKAQPRIVEASSKSALVILFPARSPDATDQSLAMLFPMRMMCTVTPADSGSDVCYSHYYAGTTPGEADRLRKQVQEAEARGGTSCWGSETNKENSQR